MGKTLRSPTTQPERSSKRKKPGLNSCSHTDAADNVLLDSNEGVELNLQSIQNTLLDLHGQYSELFKRFELMAKDFINLKEINLELLAEVKRLKPPVSTTLPTKTITSSVPTMSTFSNVVRNNLVIVKPKNTEQKTSKTITEITDKINPSIVE